MSEFTDIQWCDTTVNPIMGCQAPCELRPTPAKLRAESKTFFKGQFAGAQRAQIDRMLDKELLDYNATEIFQLREEIVAGAAKALASTRRFPVKLKTLQGEFKGMLDKQFICYAHQLHLLRGGSIAKPHKPGNPGFAKQFEMVTKFPGRTAIAARLPDLFGKMRADKPWLNGLPRTIFVSDMADALSMSIDFEYLRTEIVDVAASAHGRRHIWLWLTKMTTRMAEFGHWLRKRDVDWPDNLVAMTSVTSSKTVIRAAQLKKVPARFKGLSVEPLWEDVTIPMDGIHWCIVGGQSGLGSKPFDLAWARSLHEQCRASGTAFFVKQLGVKPVANGAPLKLRDKHGGDWNEWPADLRVREMPSGFRALGFVAMV
jgi:protein gp37